MMQPHQQLTQAWLPFADHFDRLNAAGTRLRLHAMAAGARLWRGKAPIPYVAGPATPHEVVREDALARLLLYRGRPAATRRVPLIVVASLINRFYVLDLLPELSVIARFLERGFDVYVLDWKAPGALGPSLTFRDYVDGAIVDAARAAVADDQVAVLGYCMGGTMAAMFAARHPGRVRALGLLGTPIDFHASGVLADWTGKERFDADLLVDAVGNMPPWLMQSGFKLMNPIDTLMKSLHLHLDADDEGRVRHMVALEAWLEDNIAFPGGLYRDYIKSLYQDNALVRGEMIIAGDKVDLGRIAAPLINVVGLRDHICAPTSSRALMDRVGSADRRLVEFDTGHIGLTTSHRAHKQLWPGVIAWMEQRTAV
jgi:polyhydroxyalkanoate synthase